MTATNGTSLPCAPEPALAKLLATCIGEVSTYVRTNGDHPVHHPPLARSDELGGEVVADVIFHELVHLLAKDADLADACARRADPGTISPERRRAEERRRFDDLVALITADLGRDTDLTEALSTLLGPVDEDSLEIPALEDPAEDQRRVTRWGALRARRRARRHGRGRPRETWVTRARPVVGRWTALVVFIGVIATALFVVAVMPARQLGEIGVGELFATAVLAFLPAWLYVRFLRFRAGALWTEYVLNLHRLQVDAAPHLPRPPRNSLYYESWCASGGWVLNHAPTIYQQKFDAYYGRRVSRAAVGADPPVHPETVFPVAVSSAVIAAGWLMIFRDGHVLGGDRPTRLLDLMAYGFAGAYLYNLQLLMRRFFQGDLKASAYLAAVVRFITVLILVAVLWWLPQPEMQSETGAVIAFVIGFFPLVGLQALQRLTSVSLRLAVPTLRSPHPLSDLDGLNIWYESRLLEEGIEDMQNLVTANLVDVMLHTRVPVGRLVDWVDQSHLLLHLPPQPTGWGEARRRRAARAADARRPASGRDPGAGAVTACSDPTQLRGRLRACGIRTATDLIDVLGPLVPHRKGEPSDRQQDEANATMIESWILGRDTSDSGNLRSLVTVLRRNPLLAPIAAWRRWEADPADVHRRPT